MVLNPEKGGPEQSKEVKIEMDDFFILDEQAGKVSDFGENNIEQITDLFFDEIIAFEESRASLGYATVSDLEKKIREVLEFLVLKAEKKDFQMDISSSYQIGPDVEYGEPREETGKVAFYGQEIECTYLEDGTGFRLGSGNISDRPKYDKQIREQLQKALKMFFHELKKE